MSWVLDHSKSTGTTRCVLMSIGNHLNPDGEGWVHVERVLTEANCSLDTYHRAVKWAIAAGELERDVRAGGSARVPDVRRPNQFRFPKMRPPQIAEDADSDPRKMPPSDPRKMPPSSPPQDAEDGSRAVQEPSLEPSIEDEFEAFYALHPKKVDRPVALRAFKAARKKADLAVIMDGLTRWVAYWTADGTERRFIKGPGPWLNAERWNDDPGPPRSSSASVVDDVLETFETAGVAPGATFGPGANGGRLAL